jgi:hypothetical protein
MSCFLRTKCTLCGIDMLMLPEQITEMPLLVRPASFRIGDEVISEERWLVCDGCDRALREEQAADASRDASADAAVAVGANLLQQKGFPLQGQRR